VPVLAYAKDGPPEIVPAPGIGLAMGTVSFSRRCPVSGNTRAIAYGGLAVCLFGIGLLSPVFRETAIPAALFALIYWAGRKSFEARMDAISQAERRPLQRPRAAA
jgi:uncharacterized membrane protein